MALRDILTDDHPTLRKKSRKVGEITPRILQLLDDMVDTLYEADGVGLAAPQVGILKRIVVIDCDDELYEMIDPEIIETSGEETTMEGCLSLPGQVGVVERPYHVRALYTDRSGQRMELTCEGLLARAVCHETDHLDGVLFTDRAREMLDEEGVERYEREQERRRAEAGEPEDE